MNCKLGILALVALQACYSAALAPCVCARNLNEVCGSDGQTYSNLCKLNCEIHMGKKDLTVANEGPCVPDAQSSCICTLEYKPVCGNDGNTYPNRCAMECTRSKNPNIEIANEGQCEDKIKVADYLPIPLPCICTRNQEPVCGSDGKTYANDCLLNCATANDSTLSISHTGKCGEVNIVDNAPSKSCSCTRNLKPVCGSDGVTYNNLCLLECAGQTVAKQGRC